MKHESIILALDARTVHRTHRRGTGKNLLDLYQHTLTLRPEWRVIGLHRGDETAGLASPNYRPARIEMPGDRLNAWERWRLPAAAWSAGADLLHCPANTCPTWNPMPVMITVHDLLPLDADAATADAFRRSVRHAVTNELTILTPSRFTASQLSDQFGAKSSQIVVNAWAADSALRKTDASVAARIAQRFGVSGRFILHLGAADARKNTRRVVDAFAALPQSMRQHWPLVIVGLNDPAHRNQIAVQAELLGIAADVHLTGFVHEADLAALLSGADALIYPSLAEGFGLPILDAWVTHTPVLTSNRSSLPEVGGDAVLYADPTDTDSIRHQLAVLLEDSLLRQSLVERGTARSAQFTWTATAQRFIAAVERTLAVTRGVSGGRSQRDAA